LNNWVIIENAYDELGGKRGTGYFTAGKRIILNNGDVIENVYDGMGVRAGKKIITNNGDIIENIYDGMGVRVSLRRGQRLPFIFYHSFSLRRRLNQRSSLLLILEGV